MKRGEGNVSVENGKMHFAVRLALLAVRFACRKVF